MSTLAIIVTASLLGFIVYWILKRSKIQSLRLRVAELTTELSCKMSVVVKVTSIGNLAERLACVQQRSLRRKR